MIQEIPASGVNTPCAKAWIEDSILYLEYFPQKVTLSQAKEHIKVIKEAFKDNLPMPCLSDLKKVKGTDRDVRNYLASEEVSQLNTAVAILGPSGLAKIIGNLFLKFSRPQYPTKIFSDYEKAVNWLKEDPK